MSLSTRILTRFRFGTLELFKAFPRAAQAGKRRLSQLRRKPSANVPRSLLARAVTAFLVIAVVVVIGTLGMHALEGWTYLDSFYFTSFIATGQGPPGNLVVNDPAGKVFASILAFVSVGTVVTALLFLFGPFLGRLIRSGEEKVEKLERELVDEIERHEGRRPGNEHPGS